MGVGPTPPPHRFLFGFLWSGICVRTCCPFFFRGVSFRFWLLGVLASWLLSFLASWLVALWFLALAFRNLCSPSLSRWRFGFCGSSLRLLVSLAFRVRRLLGFCTLPLVFGFGFPHPQHHQFLSSKCSLHSCNGVPCTLHDAMLCRESQLRRGKVARQRRDRAQSSPEMWAWPAFRTNLACFVLFV